MPRGVCAEVWQSSNWVRGPDFLSHKEIPYVLNTDIVDFKHGIVTKEQGSDSTSLAALATKYVKQKSFNLI